MNKPPYTKYRYLPYDDRFSRLFEREKARLAAVLPRGTKIEHVGSTTVPGLGGKGIIDIAIRCPPSTLKRFVRALERAGFVFVPSHPADARRIFMQRIVRYRGTERRIHVHLCLTDEFWRSFIVVRDYLRAHEKARADYTKIKKEAVKHARGEGQKYRAYKEAFSRRRLMSTTGAGAMPRGAT